MSDTPPRLFVSHRLLDGGMDTGAVLFDGDTLSLKEYPALTWSIEPAVHFLQVDGQEGAGGKGQDLVGKVRSNDELDALGAEHFGTAVLVEDLAYTVRPGFVAELREEQSKFTAEIRDLWVRLFSQLPDLAS